MGADESGSAGDQNPGHVNFSFQASAVGPL